MFCLFVLKAQMHFKKYVWSFSVFMLITFMKGIVSFFLKKRLLKKLLLNIIQPCY